MTNVASNATATKPETRQIVLAEIRGKRGKFSDQDLSALNDNRNLVTQLAAKYCLEKAQAQRDVDGLMRGRQI